MLALPHDVDAETLSRECLVTLTRKRCPTCASALVHSLELSLIAKMAVLLLLEGYPETVRELFAECFGKMQIDTLQDIAFLLGKASDAPSVSREIFGLKDSPEITSCLLKVWETAKSPGRSRLALQPRGPIENDPVRMVPITTALPIVSKAASSILFRTTVASLTKNAHVGTAAIVSVALTIPEAKSLKADMANEWRKVLILCNQFLKDHGSALPRHRKIYGVNGDVVPSAAYLQVQNDSFRYGSSSPDTVLGYLKSAKILVAWAISCSKDFVALDEFEVACFLKEQCVRGPSVPMGVYRGLIWAEKSMDLCLHTGSPAVVSQSNPTREFAASQATSAEMATVKMLADMEHAVSHAPGVPLKVYAGVMCALGHGVLRWKDLQRSSQLHLTADAIVGVTWQMKRKRVQIPWAALRFGISGDDWAGTWISLMDPHGMPGPDFVVHATTRDFTSFTPRIGGYADGVNAMRALLILSGMSATCAMQFTLHSWRHLFPTAARQLRLPEHEQVEMGHWATGSSMPRRYDAAACVTELIAKNAVSSAFKSGWVIAEAGCVPMDPPPMTRCPVVATSVKRPREKETKVPVIPSPISETVRVVNYVTGKVHLWSYGERTLCKIYLCGSPEKPTSTAVFADSSASTSSSSTSDCKLCFGGKLAFLRIETTATEDTGADSDDFED